MANLPNSPSSEESLRFWLDEDFQHIEQSCLNFANPTPDHQDQDQNQDQNQEQEQDQDQDQGLVDEGILSFQREDDTQYDQYLVLDPSENTNNCQEDAQNNAEVNQFECDSSITTTTPIPMPPTNWPPAPLPITCTCCQVLRDIVHSNGSYTTRLEIHGRIGIICHAVLGIRSDIDGSGVTEHHMIDFSMKCMEDVKQYLVNYCQQKKQEGFLLMQDPLQTFYSALCVGLSFDENSTEVESVQPLQTEAGYSEINNAKAESSTTKLHKSNLAAQRERTGRLKLSDLVDYFHLPIEAAAKKLEICPTVLKKICRKHGMNRWPHRKIKSMDRQISILQSNLKEKDGEESAAARAQIEKLKQERDLIRNGIVNKAEDL